MLNSLPILIEVAMSSALKLAKNPISFPFRRSLNAS